MTISAKLFFFALQYFEIMKKNQALFDSLRNNYPVFCYESFAIREEETELCIKFHFSLSEKYHFKPTIRIPRTDFYRTVSHESLDLLAFHMGMVEMVSYWKASCSPKIIVKPYHLDSDQIDWWKKLYYHGLGEFFHQNGIRISENELVTFETSSQKLPQILTGSYDDAILIPVGGGKDSAVSLEILKESGKKILPVAINPRGAIIETVQQAGIPIENLLIIKRSIDKQLLELNEKGFLNGHTPFSAMVAFSMLFMSELTGYRHIALSNESSANEATIPGTKINHQYSKSYEFEEDFRDYVNKYISKKLNYFSFLRPINELQIGTLFAQLPQHHHTFKSCNVGSKQNCWCGKCSKCLFTALMLAPHLTRDQIKNIFGTDILDDTELKPIFEQLSGKTDEKPFECVGTIDEVNAAIRMIRQKWANPLPSLIASHESEINEDQIKQHQLQFDTPHALPKELETLLHHKIRENYGL